MTPTASEFLKLFEIFGQAFGVFGPTIFGMIALWLIFARAPRAAMTPEADMLAELRAIRESLGKIHAALSGLADLKSDQDKIAGDIQAVSRAIATLDGRLSR